MRKLSLVLFINIIYMFFYSSIYASDLQNSPNITSLKRKKVETNDDRFNPPFKRKYLRNNLSNQAPEPIFKNEFSTINVVNIDETQRDHNNELLITFSFPDEILLTIFKYLNVDDIIRASQVCKKWFAISEDPQLWREVWLTTRGDYLESEATKENAKCHWLRILVNTLLDQNKIEYLTQKYHLSINYDLPYLDIKPSFYMNPNLMHSLINEKAAQGNKKFISLKLSGLMHGHYKFTKNEAAAFSYNNQLAKLNNPLAILRNEYVNNPNSFENLKSSAKNIKTIIIQNKIRRLLKKGYEKNQQERYCQKAVNLIEQYVNQGYDGAFQVKVEGLAYGFYGYKVNRQAAIDFNDSLVEQDNREAIERKLKGLKTGEYGYSRDNILLEVFKKHLLQSGHKEGIKSIVQYYFNENESINDFRRAVALNDILIEKHEDEEAISTKIEILAGYFDDNIRNPDCYGEEECECDPLEHTGLKDLNTLNTFIDYYIERGSRVAIEGKFKSIFENFFHNTLEEIFAAIKEWIEVEERRGKRWAYFYKSQGLKYGVFGFKKNEEEAIKYIQRYHIPFYLKNWMNY